MADALDQNPVVRGPRCRRAPGRPLHRPPSKVDLLRVLDSMRSAASTLSKFQLQREAYPAAVSNPRVLDAVLLGP